VRQYKQRSALLFFYRSHVLEHPQNHFPRQGGVWLTCANISHPVWNDKVGEVLSHTVLEVVGLLEKVGKGIPRQHVPRVEAHRKNLGRQRPGQHLLPWCWGGGVPRRLPDAMLGGEHIWAGSAPNNGCAKSLCPLQVRETVPHSNKRSAKKQGKAEKWGK